MNSKISTKRTEAKIMEAEEPVAPKPASVSTEDLSKEFIEALSLAAQTGDTDKARECLANFPADLNAAKARCHFTPLHYAAEKGHYDITKLLLEKGADVTATALGQYLTPMHYVYHHCDASLDQKMPVMKLLLNYGAASTLNNKNGADYDSTILHRAAHLGDIKAAMFFIKHGSDINAADLYGKTPIHEAVTSLKNSSEIVEWLDKQKSRDYGCSRNNSYSRLHNQSPGNKDYDIISESKYTEMIKLLLKKGADSTLCSHGQENSLVAALDPARSYCNCHNIVELLKSEGLIQKQPASN